MEALSNILAPHVQIIGQAAGTLTLLQFLSGIVIVKEIRQRRQSDFFSPEPIFGGLILSVISAKFGSIINDATMFNVNAAGFLINIAYSAVLFWYASDNHRSNLWRKLGVCAIISGLCLIYTSWEEPSKLEMRLGLIITTILVVMIGAPLLSVPHIIRTKSSEGLPFPFIVSGTVVAVSWTLYGLALKNYGLTYQNLFLVCLSGFQLALCIIYPPNTNTKPKKDKSTTAKED